MTPPVALPAGTASGIVTAAAAAAAPCGARPCVSPRTAGWARRSDWRCRCGPTEALMPPQRDSCSQSTGAGRCLRQPVCSACVCVETVVHALLRRQQMQRASTGLSCTHRTVFSPTLTHRLWVVHRDAQIASRDLNLEDRHAGTLVGCAQLSTRTRCI